MDDLLEALSQNATVKVLGLEECKLDEVATQSFLSGLKTELVRSAVQQVNVGKTNFSSLSEGFSLANPLMIDSSPSNPKTPPRIP